VGGSDDYYYDDDDIDDYDDDEARRGCSVCEFQVTIIKPKIFNTEAEKVNPRERKVSRKNQLVSNLLRCARGRTLPRIILFILYKQLIKSFSLRVSSSIHYRTPPRSGMDISTLTHSPHPL